MMLICLLVVLGVSLTYSKPIVSMDVAENYFSQYRNQKIISISREDGESLSRFAQVYDVLQEAYTDSRIIVRVDGESLGDFHGADVQVLVEDVADMVWKERKQIESHRSLEGADFYDDYRNIDELYDRYYGLAAEFSDIMTLSRLGGSVENRDVLIGQISTGGSGSRSVYFVESTQHAREWVATMTLCYIIETLLYDYRAGVPDAVKVLNAVDVHFIPIVNPDGYSYAWTNDRFWRKNRAFNTGGSRGVDLNRNWNVSHCGVGSSTSPTSDTYCGPYPFSEPETTLSSTYQRGLGPRQNIAVDIHTYGSLILRPFQVNNSIAPDETRNQAAGAVIQEAIRSVHGMTYDNIRGVQLYAHSGGFVDWTYMNLNNSPRPVTFTMELRGNSFDPLPSQIILACEENYAGQVALIIHVNGL